MTLERGSLGVLSAALEHLEGGFADLPEFDPPADAAALARVLGEVAERMRDNFPYPHPLYAGQMLKPPHPVARLAYALSLWVNPNNHALDGGRASSAMEREAVAAIAAMLGLPNHLGHLAAGGTMANLEALWAAGRLAPTRRVVASEQAHYTHGRLSEVLGLDFDAVPTDAHARMDVAALERRLAAGGVGTVVATLGTTAAGAVDPLAEILALRDRFGFRLHVDAAYGGYFALCDGLEAGDRAAFDAISEADSVVIDPHKHGLQPYGCGCVLFRDPAVGALYRHDSPYTYFSSAELHLGEISLECSRAGASAVALWATQRLLPMERGGEFAAGLDRSLSAARRLHAALEGSQDYRTVFPPALDIVVWAPSGARAGEVSARARRCFDEAAARGLHLALAAFPRELISPWWPELEFDQPRVTCLRSCLMKAEHLDWVDRISGLLGEIGVETRAP